MTENKGKIAKINGLFIFDGCFVIQYSQINWNKTPAIRIAVTLSDAWREMQEMDMISACRISCIHVQMEARRLPGWKIVEKRREQKVVVVSKV